MAPAAIDLDAPFERDIILEVRSSRMKTMPGLTITSGIDKKMRHGRVNVSRMGLDEDEHDPTFHGGIDKAVHGYCSSHYPSWQAEFPEAADRFVPGGFGENLVTARMNERNVCIGDVVSVGTDGLVLQVSLPRQPCFKLNHRFKLKNFAPNTYKLSRTGWYYRVLHPGSIEAGDEIRLVERRWPEWTIERVQEYLHRNKDDAAANAELAAIEDLGEESRGNFVKRVAKQKALEKRAATATGKEKWREYKIVEKKKQTERVVSLVFEAQTPVADPQPGRGSYARMKLPNGLVRSYSITSGDENSFELGVALDAQSRGGSAYLHREAQEGTVIRVGGIFTSVTAASMASNHVFLVGGIGITAFLSVMEKMRRIHLNMRLHYAVRSADDVPFRDRLAGLGDAVRLYDGSRGERIDIPAVFGALSWNSHVYVCGPQRMMDEAMREARACGLGEGEVHFEAFAADATGDAFEVTVVARSRDGGAEQKTLQVAAEQTLLEVVGRYFDVPSSCEVGNCGTCKVALKCGRVDHRGTALGEEEKKEALLACVSRGIGSITIEI